MKLVILCLLEQIACICLLDIICNIRTNIGLSDRKREKKDSK